MHGGKRHHLFPIPKVATRNQTQPDDHHDTSSSLCLISQRLCKGFSIKDLSISSIPIPSSPSGRRHKIRRQEESKSAFHRGRRSMYPSFKEKVFSKRWRARTPPTVHTSPFYAFYSSEKLALPSPSAPHTNKSDAPAVSRELRALQKSSSRSSLPPRCLA